MRLVLCALVLATGCDKTDPLYCKQHMDDVATCGGQADAAIDADQHVNCFGPPGPFEVCLGPGPLPTGTVQIPNTFDTTNDPLCRATQPDGWTADPACFVVASSITSSTTPTQIVGSRPLVLVALQDITIDHPLIASTARGGPVGPGTTATPCTGATDGMTGGTANMGGGGGGAGGSYQTHGGNGGVGDVVTTPGVAGVSNPTLPPTLLRAGCPGTAGGMLSGAPGLGGGAVYLLAGATITISSTINASGAGAGAGASTSSGGAGGGSGGMIALFAPTITSTGSIFANGGGGASGGDASSSKGIPGADATLPLTPAPGGCCGSGGAGGNGFAGVVPLGNAIPGSPPNSSLRGGGGGGGGGGYILAPNTAMLGTNVSPPPRQF
jgi:hypothetical protein